MMSAMALSAIRGYQRYLSPRKGYACAYRLRHGGTVCSGYAKAAIADHGVICALPLARARFRACRAAALTMDGARGLPPQKRNRDRWWFCCDPGGCDMSFCGRGKTGPDVTPDGCDCTPD